MRKSLTQIQSEEAKNKVCKDREAVDQILANINEENRRLKEQKRKKKEETKAIIQQYQEEREEKKNQIAREERERNDAIAAYIKMTQTREEEQKRKKSENEAERNRMWNIIADGTQNFKNKRDEYDELRAFLWDQERQEREILEMEEFKTKQIKQREELLQQNIEQIEAKKKVLMKIKEEEMVLVKEMLDKFAADEEDEKRKKDTAEAAKYEYVTEAKKQREERELMYKQERQIERQEMLKNAKLDEFKKVVIAEARKLLLERHAKEVEGFLPKVSELKMKSMHIIVFVMYSGYLYNRVLCQKERLDTCRFHNYL